MIYEVAVSYNFTMGNMTHERTEWMFFTKPRVSKKEISAFINKVREERGFLRLNENQIHIHKVEVISVYHYVTTYGFIEDYDFNRKMIYFDRQLDPKKSKANVSDGGVYEG